MQLLLALLIILHPHYILLISLPFIVIIHAFAYWFNLNCSPCLFMHIYLHSSGSVSGKNGSRATAAHSTATSLPNPSDIDDRYMVSTFHSIMSNTLWINRKWGMLNIYMWMPIHYSINLRISFVQFLDKSSPHTFPPHPPYLPSRATPVEQFPPRQFPWWKILNFQMGHCGQRGDFHGCNCPGGIYLWWKLSMWGCPGEVVCFTVLYCKIKLYVVISQNNTLM